MDDKRSLTYEIDILISKCQETDLSMKEIIDELGFRGHAFITLILATPFCSPLPTFGLSAIFGLVISFVGIYITLKKNPYIPEKYSNQKIPKEHLSSFLKYSKKFLTFLEKFVSPRFGFLNRILPVRTTSAIIISICGVLLALPLPPGTNAPPAITIVILSLSLLEEDNLLYLLGVILFLLNIVLFGAIIFAGASAVDYILKYFSF